MNARNRLAWMPMAMMGALLLSALVFLYQKTQSSGELGYFEDLALLQQLKQVEAEWELNVLKSRIGLNANYDPLSNAVAELNGLMQRLEASDGGPDLEKKIADLHAAIQKKSAAVEQFKSHNALLRNSQTFLPTAADDVQQAIRASTDAGQPPLQRLAIGVNQLLLASMLYSQNPSEDRSEEVLVRLNNLDTKLQTPSSTVGEKLEIFSSHVRVVLREQKLVDDLLNSVTEVPTAARIDAVNRALNSEQQEAGSRTREYRTYLLAFSTTLVGLLLYAAFRLLRNHAVIRHINTALQNANDGLENRVQERTSELRRTQAELIANAREITSANEALQAEIGERKHLQGQLMQSEKLASIGQLAAGVAHEINNPIGYVFSNFGTLEKYIASLFEILAAYEDSERTHTDANTVASLCKLKERAELDFLKEDIPALMRESEEGLVRVRKIVKDLKDFSHVDAKPRWQMANLMLGIDSTLNVVNNEVKYKADIVKEYGDLPEVQCLAPEINQVVMNLVVNAAQAIGPERGTITIRTGAEGHNVWIEVADTGSGIPPESLPRIFDPFYPPKPVGKGTGLGLSLSYGIVQKHNGHIEVKTEAGVGTCFRVTLPIAQPQDKPVELEQRA